MNSICSCVSTQGFPNYWSVVTQFASQGSQSLQPQSVKIAVDNLVSVDEKAFLQTSSWRMKSTHCVWVPPIQIHLASFLFPRTLAVHSVAVNYWFETIEEVTSHWILRDSCWQPLSNCPKVPKGCSFRQYYGYSSQGSQSTVYYDVNWVEHEHFISTSGTAFEMSLLRKFDTELLLGQISYNQMADIP